jgi:hypothetical protein
MARKSTGLPDLKLYLTTRRVHGSRRRGRNAVNMWAADTLVACARRERAIQGCG